MTKEEINTLIRLGRNKEDYRKDYNNLIKSCKKRGLDKSKLSFYSEIHHCNPRCRGGSDDPSNLCLLSAEEHIIAHILLWHIYPDHPGITLAAYFMATVNARNHNVPKDVSKEISIILENLDIELVAKLRETKADQVKQSVVAWNLDLVGNIKVWKVYDYLTEVSLLENRESDHGWRILGKHLDDGRYHKGYYWSSIEKFKENYPDILEEYYKNPTPKEKQIPVLDKETIFSQNLDPLICIDDNFNVLKVYKFYGELLEDGFGITPAKKAAKKNTMSMGNRWTFLSHMRNYHKDKLEEFVEKSHNGYDIGIPIVPKDGKTSKKQLLIYDPKTYQVLKVYNLALESKVDGFDGFRLAQKAEAFEKGKDNNYNGHYVSYVKSWKYPEKLKEYYKNPPKINIQNNMSDSITILKCDINKDIISVSENRLKLDGGGIWDNNNKLSEKIDRELLHRGYYYYHPAYYKNHYPDKWENYQTNGCTGCEFLNSKMIVEVDDDFNIVGDYYIDEYQDRRKLDDDSETYILQGKRVKESKLVWRLHKFIEKYPDKWLDYLRHKKENSTITESDNGGIDKIV